MEQKMKEQMERIIGNHKSNITTLESEHSKKLEVLGSER
jgi:hypothetical protein